MPKKMASGGSPTKDLSEKRGTPKTPPPEQEGSEKPRRKASVPGSVNPERRCTATAHRTGERCKAPAIKGGNVCRVHGGAAPQVRRSARERLLDLVEPAINELAKLLNRNDVDDSTKLRAIQLLLDRTGYGPSANIKVEDTRWDAIIAQVADAELDRDLTGLPSAEHERGLPHGGGGGDMPLGYEDVETAVQDANADEWREYDAEDDAEAERGRIRPDENTIQGEVVDPEERNRSDWTEGPLNGRMPGKVPGTEYDPRPQERYGDPLPTFEQRLKPERS